MRNQQLRHKKSLHLLSLVCLTLLLTASIRTQESENFATKSVRLPIKLYTAAVAARGRYNGKLIFASDRQAEGGVKLWTMNSDGSNPTQLTFESDRDPSLPSYVHVYDDRPKWSPDGKKIAFRSNRIEDPDNDPYTIYIMDFGSRSVRRLVVNQLRCKTCTEICSEIWDFEWSPDGARLVLQFGKLVTAEDICLGGWDTDIYTVNTDGTGLVALTNASNVLNSGPTWSPDGTQIAFISSDQTGLGTQSIDVINADGSNRHQIARFALDYGSTTWSPDGSKILFSRAWQLFTINPDGTDLKQLTYNPDNHQNPRWSPDGTKIAFVRNVKPSTIQYAIFMMNADGSEEQNISNQVIRIPADYDVDWQPLLAPANTPVPSVLGFDSGIDLAMYPNPPTVQINVMRNGNLNQAVSCDYQTHSGAIATTPSGTFSFAPGEALKTINFSYTYISSLNSFTIDLLNNGGNATFIGGLKHATIIFVGQNGNPIDNSAYFVRQQYRDFLNREPDSSGWDFWTDNIDSCGTKSTCLDAQRVNTSAAFFLSIEFQQTGYLVYRTYKAAHGNLPGAPVPIRFNEFLPDTQQIGQGVIVGQSGWEQALETNKQNFMTSFVQRSRFTSSYPSSMTVQQFVDALYTNAGIVPTSAPNRPKAISEFNSTTPADPAARARALRDVAEDPMLTQQEFNRAFVLMQYFGYLRRNPNDAPDSDFSGYNFWLEKLDQFGGNYQAAEMVKAFIVSTEYRQRFGP